MRNIGGKTSLRPVYKKSQLSISLDQHSKLLYSLFLLHVQVDVYQIISKQKWWSHALTLFKAFFKIKRGLDVPSLHHFLCYFWWKIFVTSYSINWSKLIDWLHLLFEILGSMCILICGYICICYPVCDILNFEIKLSYQTIFLHEQKVRTKV